MYVSVNSLETADASQTVGTCVGGAHAELEVDQEYW